MKNHPAFDNGRLARQLTTLSISLLIAFAGLAYALHGLILFLFLFDLDMVL